jgi:hypothetical protein
MAACGGLAARLEVPPGHRVVLAGVDLRRLDVLGGLLEIVREDGVVRLDVPLQRDQTAFAVTLPPGRYRIARFNGTDSPSLTRLPPSFALRGTFEVGDAPAVYVGTLRLIQDRFATFRLEVADDYQRTVDALRARYRDLPATVVRGLAQAG